MSPEPNQLHEPLIEKTPVRIGSDRSFGLVFALFFLVSGFLSKQDRSPLLIGATLFFVVSCLYPLALRPLNRIWFHLGMGLSKITNPLIMFVLFYVIFAPFSLILKALGSPLFSIRPQSDLATYWKDTRDEPAHSPKRQY